MTASRVLWPSTKHLACIFKQRGIKVHTKVHQHTEAQSRAFRNCFGHAGLLQLGCRCVMAIAIHGNSIAVC